MKLASGAAPVTKYLAAGVALGLGTDGAASNNDLDMFEAMRQASFLAKHVDAGIRRRCRRRRRSTWRPSAAPARCGMERLIGSLEAGKRADLITVSMRAARQTPMYDPVSHLVYATRGDDVRTTIVNGKVLMKERQVRTLNRAAVIADAKRAGGRVRRCARRLCRSMS